MASAILSFLHALPTAFTLEVLVSVMLVSSTFLELVNLALRIQYSGKDSVSVLMDFSILVETAEHVLLVRDSTVQSVEQLIP